MVLLGLELDELSMNPLAIPRVKKIIRGATLKESKALLKKVMTLSSAIEIRAWVEKTMQERSRKNFQTTNIKADQHHVNPVRPERMDER